MSNRISLIPADEARKEPESADPTDAEIAAVNSAIRANFKTTKYCHYYKPLSKQMENLLRKEGYRFETLPDVRGEGTTIKISWE